MSTQTPYRAVTRSELIEILGAMCSPDPRREGYVVGPDATGRLCHCATCSSMGQAQETAARMNAARTKA